MTGWIAILVSAASGAVVRLVGGVTGGMIASRSQRREWLRDKQVDPCSVVVQQSTTVQLALLRQWKHQDWPDWTARNQALAMIWLVGTPAVREAAKQIGVRAIAPPAGHAVGDRLGPAVPRCEPLAGWDADRGAGVACELLTTSIEVRGTAYLMA